MQSYSREQGELRVMAIAKFDQSHIGTCLAKRKFNLNSNAQAPVQLAWFDLSIGDKQ